jgi:uncharacterized protein YndB with AHSA1/START domain
MICKGTAGVAALIGLLFVPLAVPSRPIVTTINIGQPPTTTFQYVTTPANWPKWHPSSLSVTGAVDHSLEVGEAVQEAFSVAGRKGIAIWTVRDRQVPALWVIDGQSKDGGGGATITYSLSATDTGTRFVRTMVYRMPNLGLAALDRLSLHDRIAAESVEALQKLKIELEKAADKQKFLQ